MRQVLAIVVTLLSLAALARAQHEGHSPDHDAGAASRSSDAPIQITINPEARVSVARGGALPPAVACWDAMELAVRIVNHGFVTASLQASLVGSVPNGVALEFSAEPLKGTPGAPGNVAEGRARGHHNRFPCQE
ncbi:MAG: hypothetical protein ACREXP_03955 [Steroidobacteraceae bacterium]